MSKKKITKTIKVELEPLYKAGDIVILKDNLLAVEIKEVFIKAKRYCYSVRYAHKDWHGEDWGWFHVFENELEEKSIYYEQELMAKYIEYKSKYEQLLNQLTGGHKFKK